MEAETLTFHAPQETSLTFCNSKGNVFTIKPDGTIEKGPAFTTQDEASQTFWDAISYYFPKWKESCK